MYFRRALKQNRNYLSAWTLMGHEYVEMKNPPAAIGELSVLWKGGDLILLTLFDIGIAFWTRVLCRAAYTLRTGQAKGSFTN